MANSYPPSSLGGGSSSGGGGRTPSLSASAIVAQSLSGSHVLKIEGYSRIKQLGPGKCINSQSFSIGGHRWCLRYYPHGYSAFYTEWMSIFLCLLDHTEVNEVKAQFKISMLFQTGRLVPWCSKGSNKSRAFSSKQAFQGFSDFIKLTELEKPAILKDDCFHIRCDVTVEKEIFTEDIPFPALCPRGNTVSWCLIRRD